MMQDDAVSDPGEMMTRKLFELVGADASRPFSPYCRRTRMALAHKGLDAETIPWRFTEKAAIAPYKSEKVPVLLDGERAVALNCRSSQ
jgi:glutathione S-transferase